MHLPCASVPPATPTIPYLKTDMTLIAPSPTLHHILLIEDDPGHVRLVREALCYHPRIYLHAVEQAVQALHFLTHREEYYDAPVPSLIVLDLRLPLFSGKILLEERRRRGLCAAPVVVLTSSAGARLDCMTLGADAFHLKPDDWSGWQRLIRALVLDHLQIDLHLRTLRSRDIPSQAPGHPAEFTRREPPPPPWAG